MDLETAIQAFGSSGHDLPHEVLQWTLDHWEEVAPELLGMLERRKRREKDLRSC